MNCEGCYVVVSFVVLSWSVESHTFHYPGGYRWSPLQFETHRESHTVRDSDTISPSRKPVRHDQNLNDENLHGLPSQSSQSYSHQQPELTLPD